MTEMDGSSNSKTPQISEMFQKFALAFKTKTFEFFADNELPEDSDGFSLLDSAEEMITDLKVVVIKPDPEKTLDGTQMIQPEETQDFSLSMNHLGPEMRSLGKTHVRNFDTKISQTLISLIFSTISSFEASYLQLQTAHVPFSEASVKTADKALVSHLQKLSDFKHFYRDFCTNHDLDVDFPVGSCLEAQVQENQSKLRILGTVSDRLQSEIDCKDSEVLALKKKLGEIQKFNCMLSNKLSGNLNSCSEVLLSVGVFDSVLRDACRATNKFTTILMELMGKAGWDMDLAANSVYNGIAYTKKGHNRYAFLSYICLGLFKDFNSERFGSGENEVICNNGHVEKLDMSKISLKQLLEHVSSNPMELLSRNRDCEFSKFCEKKYQELIHPTMESSIFRNMDQKEVILNSWRSLSVFYKSFVKMTSSIWTLHKLAFLFDPVVEIFQVERGADFSMVYMEDITRKCMPTAKMRAKVGFTVIPGFKIGGTVIQSQVYLCGFNCTDDNHLMFPSVENCVNGHQ